MVFIPPVHEGYDVGDRVPAGQLDVLFYGGRVNVRDDKTFRNGEAICPVRVVEQCYFETVFLKIERVSLFVIEGICEWSRVWES